MLDFFGGIAESLVAFFWGLLLPIPMPWRAAIVLAMFFVGSYQLAYRLLALVLLPEFWITNQLRRWGYQPVPGTQEIDDLIISLIKLLRWLALLGTIFASVCVIVWYMRTYFEKTIVATYIERAIYLWDVVERGVLDIK